MTPGGRPGSARTGFVLVSVLLGVVLGVLGVVLGVACTLLHGVEAGAVPVGLLGTGLATLGATQLAGRGARSRPYAVLPGLCWLVVVVVLTTQRPEGDFLLGGGWLDWGYLLAGTAGIVLGLLLTPAYPRAVARRDHPSPAAAVPARPE